MTEIKIQNSHSRVQILKGEAPMYIKNPLVPLVSGGKSTFIK